jgi:hypothetical protein
MPVALPAAVIIVPSSTSRAANSLGAVALQPWIILNAAIGHQRQLRQASEFPKRELPHDRRPRQGRRKTGGYDSINRQYRCYSRCRLCSRPCGSQI